MEPVKLRYGIYGLAVLSLGAAYYVLDGGQEAEKTQPGRGVAHQSEELPMLRLALPEGETKVKRDVFAYLAALVPVAVKEPEPVPEAPPAKVTDRFADLHVLGVVSQNGERAVLIRAGDQTFTILEGERFGEDEALDVSSIDGSKISVSDNISGISKTFLLSEE